MENKEQAQMNTPAVEGVSQTEAAAPPELTITDLSNIRSVVDAAVRRGAFGAAEISAVGAAFDKLNNFLNAVAPAKDSAAAPQE
jgi:hypothetical protein